MAAGRATLAVAGLCALAVAGGLYEPLAQWCNSVFAPLLIVAGLVFIGCDVWVERRRQIKQVHDRIDRAELAEQQRQAALVAAGHEE